jgi:hypothetical protein
MCLKPHLLHPYLSLPQHYTNMSASTTICHKHLPTPSLLQRRSNTSRRLQRKPHNNKPGRNGKTHAQCWPALQRHKQESNASTQLVELMQTQNQCMLCQLLQICTFSWQLRDPKCALLKSCGLGWPLSTCTGEFKHSGHANVARSFKRKSHKSNLWLQH